MNVRQCFCFFFYDLFWNFNILWRCHDSQTLTSFLKHFKCYFSNLLIFFCVCVVWDAMLYSPTWKWTFWIHFVASPIYEWHVWSVKFIASLVEYALCTFSNKVAYFEETNILFYFASFFTKDDTIEFSVHCNLFKDKIWHKIRVDLQNAQKYNMGREKIFQKYLSM